ncbi:MAG: alpha/beta hydrolase, partial [Dokdonella sp.]
MHGLILVVLIALCAICASAHAAVPALALTSRAATEIGTRDGAAYRIDIPANWNRGLVVFFHGYAIDPITFRKGERLSPMFDSILGRGFALIQSAYSKTGWAVEEGSADSERLRRYFIAKHGAPKRTFAMGMSMGGTLTVMAMETQPQVYT